MTTGPGSGPGLSKCGLFAGLFVCILIAGCAGQSRTIDDPVTPAQSFTTSGEKETPDRWWTVFGDAGLDAVVDSALSYNFDLRIAVERLQAARAVTDRASAQLIPALEGTGSAKTTRTEGADGTSETLQLGLAASYEVDLWGRIRSGVRAEQLRTEAAGYGVQSAALTVAADITLTWFRIAEAHSRIALIERQVETNRTVLQLLENRFGTGLVRAVDILRQRQLIESTHEELAVAESRRRTLENQLDVLAGRIPGSRSFDPPSDLPVLPGLPKTGVPLELTRRRPDIRAAYMNLRAADNDVASAVSALFPRLSLNASATTTSATADGLFRDWAASLAGNILAPLFYGDELRAEVDRTRAVRDQRLYEYGRTVLIAFREVEDALALESAQQDRLDRIRSQLELADQAYEQLRIQYLNGSSNYLDVLTALDEVQILRRDFLSARLVLVETRIGLYRALAGPIDAMDSTT